MKILRLPIKRKWFELIHKGEKLEEYREIKPFYVSRLIKFKQEMMDFEVKDFCDEVYKKDLLNFNDIHEFIEYYDVEFKNYDYFELSNGYGKHVPKLFFKFSGVEIKRGNKEWGANDNFCFVIKIGEPAFIAECPYCENNNEVDGLAYGNEDCKSCGEKFLWSGNRFDTKITTMKQMCNAVGTALVT